MNENWQQATGVAREMDGEAMVHGTMRREDIFLIKDFPTMTQYGQYCRWFSIHVLGKDY